MCVHVSKLRVHGRSRSFALSPVATHRLAWRRTRVRGAVLIATLVAAVSPLTGEASEQGFPGLSKRLTTQSRLLVEYTDEFKRDAAAYDAMAGGAGYDYAKLWRSKPQAVRTVVSRMKQNWLAHNADYERMEGIVAGVPSLVGFDVNIDAGTSFAEDPKSAVTFSLKTKGGQTFRQPGAFYNITEAALWGEDSAFVAKGVTPDLDGDGRIGEFGESLPDAQFLLSDATSWDQEARRLLNAAQSYKPNTKDALTALVVMVPTMNEYFGDWKNSRFVVGAKATSTSFNAASRLNDIHDILSSLRVVYADVKPAIERKDTAQAAQTQRELDSLATFVERIYRREQAGHRFKPQEADLLGAEAQDRAIKIAGQVSQAAARLGISVSQG